VPLRKIAIARTISPLVMSCMDSFRDAYARTGMNLMQSIVVVSVGILQRAGRALKRPAPRRGKQA